jgi:hypothetical protein
LEGAIVAVKLNAEFRDIREGLMAVRKRVLFTVEKKGTGLHFTI